MWLEQSERRGEGEEGMAGRGPSQVIQGLGSHRQHLGFLLWELGALEGCGQRRAGPDPGVHSGPLVAAAGRASWEGGQVGRRVEGTAPVPGISEPRRFHSRGVGLQGGRNLVPAHDSAQ